MAVDDCTQRGVFLPRMPAAQVLERQAERNLHTEGRCKVNNHCSVEGANPVASHIFKASPLPVSPIFPFLLFSSSCTLTGKASKPPRNFQYSHLPPHSSNHVNELHLARDLRFLAANDPGRHQ